MRFCDGYWRIYLPDEGREEEWLKGLQKIRRRCCDSILERQAGKSSIDEVLRNGMTESWNWGKLGFNSLGKWEILWKTRFWVCQKAEAGYWKSSKFVYEVKKGSPKTEADVGMAILPSDCKWVADKILELQVYWYFMYWFFSQKSEKFR